MRRTLSNPPRMMDEAQKRNSTSIVLRMDFGKASFLFTGDVNGRKKGAPIDACDDQERFMVNNNTNPDNVLFGSLDCDVLKVAHHGSDGSSSLDFLKAVSPTWAVVPTGFPHGHPHDPVLARLMHADVGLDDEHILRTDESDDDEADRADETTLGDDCFIFTLDPEGIVKIEKWNVTVEED